MYTIEKIQLLPGTVKENLCKWFSPSILLQIDPKVNLIWGQTTSAD